MNGNFDTKSKVWSGIELSLPFPENVHINKIVLDALSQNLEKVIQISADDGTEMTCEELKLKIVRVALNLTAIGINDGDVIGVVCANSIDLMAFVHGIIQIGAIVHPLYIGLGFSDLTHMLRLTKPKLILCDSEAFGNISQVLRSLDSDAIIYTTTEKFDGVRSSSELLLPVENEDNYEPAVFENPFNKPIVIRSSSGTTGPAKGVIMSQEFFLRLRSLYPENSRSLNFAPIFWGTGFTLLITTPITLETRIVTIKSFSPETFLDIAMKFKATRWIVDPLKVGELVQSPLMEKVNKSEGKFLMIVGVLIPEKLRKMIREILPTTNLLIGYGLTEISVSATFPGQPLDDLSVGFIMPNHQVKIVDESGKALNIGETGEI